MRRAIYIAECTAATSILLAAFVQLQAKEKEKPLLKVRQSIVSFGWTQNRTLEVKQNGRISLEVQHSAPLSGRIIKVQKSDEMLNTAEVPALRDLLAGPAIQDLRDSYSPPGLAITSDYYASMEIEMTIFEKSKRIVLPDLREGAHDSKIYPAPLLDLICKINGLEQRLGVHYGRSVLVDKDGRESDDTLCDSGSLELIPKPAH